MRSCALRVDVPFSFKSKACRLRSRPGLCTAFGPFGGGQNNEEISIRAGIATAFMAVPGALAVMAQDDAVRIALIHGMSGSPLEAYSRQTRTGFMMGLEYATDGTMQIKGRDIEIIEKDSQFQPDVARALLAEAYGDDDALIAVGDTSSGVALSMLPIAEEYERILIVEPAVADSLTGPESNRYVFKTSRNFLHGHAGQALALQPDETFLSRRWPRTMPSAVTVSLPSRPRSKAPAPRWSPRVMCRCRRPTSPPHRTNVRRAART